MPIRALLVEDEPHSRDRLASLLAAHPDVEVVGAAGDGPKAVELIDELRPDVVFLDIQLPEYSGFEVLARAQHRPDVVFVTAYDEYAVRAFEEKALDYLLKPVSEARLNKAVERVRAGRRTLDEATVAAIRLAVERPRYPQRLAVRQKGAILLAPVEGIYWLSAEDHYIVLRTFDGEYLYDGALKELEELLDPEQFIRIHRSQMVAQAKIERITHTDGRYAVEMADRQRTLLPVGRVYLARLRERFRF